jgi:hypothetical protein
MALEDANVAGKEVVAGVGSTADWGGIIVRGGELGTFSGARIAVGRYPSPGDER